MADQAHIKRERAKARELKASQWWKNRIGPGICHHCGNKFPKSTLTMDHLTPLARGGKSTKSNIVPSCRSCNQSRGHKLDVERTLADMDQSPHLWLGPEVQKLLGQAPLAVNCFGISQFYFVMSGSAPSLGGFSIPRKMTAEEMLEWVSGSFMQIESPLAYAEPTLVLVWTKSDVAHQSHQRDRDSNLQDSQWPYGRPPLINDLVKRRPGYPFAWVLEHSFVLVEPIAKKLEAGQDPLRNLRVFEKASAHTEHVVGVLEFGDAIRSYLDKPGFALSFHLRL